MSFELIAKGTPDECWPWMGRLDAYGYGAIGRHGKAHRWTWEQVNDCTIPRGLVIRHSCDNRRCCNPAHLLLGTQAENNADTWKRSGRERLWGDPLAKSQQTHCKYGHPFDEQNTYWYQGTRKCVACSRERTRRYRREAKR